MLDYALDDLVREGLPALRVEIRVEDFFCCTLRGFEENEAVPLGPAEAVRTGALGSESRLFL